MVRIYTYEAGPGDFIRIRYKADTENKYHNLIIDSGKRIPKTDKKTKSFAAVLSEIHNSEEDQMDGIIISHWDDDHIEGFFEFTKFIKSEAPIDLGTVYMNSGAFWNYPVKIPKTAHSPAKELSVAEFLTAQGIRWIDGTTIEVQTTEKPLYSIGGAEIWAISPGQKQLELLKKKDGRVADFAKETVGHAHAGIIKTPDSFINELKESYTEDKSEANGSSIAFLFKYDGVSIACLGDAHPSVCVEGLERLGYSAENVCHVDLIKIPHHGSIHNYSQPLYTVLQSDAYLLSTCGPVNSGNLLPNKSTLAHLLLEVPHDRNRLVVYSNYKWWLNDTHKDRYFKNDKDITIQDLALNTEKTVTVQYEQNNYVLSLVCVNKKETDKCTQVTNNLEIYSCL